MGAYKTAMWETSEAAQQCMQRRSSLTTFFSVAKRRLSIVFDDQHTDQHVAAIFVDAIRSGLFQSIYDGWTPTYREHAYLDGLLRLCRRTLFVDECQLSDVAEMLDQFYADFDSAHLTTQGKRRRLRKLFDRLPPSHVPCVVNQLRYGRDDIAALLADSFVRLRTRYAAIVRPGWHNADLVSIA